MPLDSDAYKGAVVSEAVAKSRAQRADESMVRASFWKFEITWSTNNQQRLEFLFATAVCIRCTAFDVVSAAQPGVSHV